MTHICQALTKYANHHDEARTVVEKHVTAIKMLEHLNARRKESWILTVENIDIKHSIQGRY